MSWLSLFTAAGLAAVAASLAVPLRLSVHAPVEVPAGAGTEASEGVARFRIALSLASGTGAAVVIGGAVGACVGLVATVAVWQLIARMETPASRRRREQLTAALPHVVDLMSSSLSAGSSPPTALELAARAVDSPMREELLLVTSRLDLGMDPVLVWKDVGAHAQLGALGRTLARATESGAPVSEAMCRLGEDLRRDARADVENRARSVGVKAAAPLGLCLLPAFVLVGVVPLVASSIGTVLDF